jgi:hypothetical protein
MGKTCAIGSAIGSDSAGIAWLLILKSHNFYLGTESANPIHSDEDFVNTLIQLTLYGQRALLHTQKDLTLRGEPEVFNYGRYKAI